MHKFNKADLDKAGWFIGAVRVLCCYYTRSRVQKVLFLLNLECFHLRRTSGLVNETSRTNLIEVTVVRVPDYMCIQISIIRI